MRRGVTLVELLIATSIVGILAGIAVPAASSVRQSTLAQTALTALRAVDVAVTTSCARGVCGPFVDSGSVSPAATTVPASLAPFLPTGFVFSTDTSSWALQLESWTVGPYLLSPMCMSSCLGVATGPTSAGFTNNAAAGAAPTITVSVAIITRSEDLAQALYGRAGGAPPVFITSQSVWKYSYPVLVAVPAGG